MKKMWLFVFALIVLIIGCTNDDPAKDGVYYGGIDGVSIEFVDIAPPREFDQDDSVSVKVVLSNKGETDVTTGNAVARLFGLNFNNFGLSDGYKETVGVLRGKSELRAEGGQQEIDFGNLQYKLPVTNVQDFTLRARVCYPYVTETLVDVCLKSSLSREAGEEVCSVEGEKVVDGSVSSGPIQVTSITEETRGSNQVRFDITVENQGLGEVFNPGADCEDLDDPLSKRAEENMILFEVANPEDVECDFRLGEPSNSGMIELENNLEVVTCWKTVKDPVEDKLDIKLSYIYRDSTSKVVTIFEST